MAKVAKKSNVGAFLLELIAGLLLFGVAWMWGTAAPMGAWAWPTALFFAVAVVASITLLLGSFGNLMGAENGKMQMKAVVIAAFAVIFLAQASVWMWVAALGLLLGLLGSWSSMM